VICESKCCEECVEATVLARNLPHSWAARGPARKKEATVKQRVSERKTRSWQPSRNGLPRRPLRSHRNPPHPSSPSSVQSSPRVAQLPVTGAVQVGLWKGATRRPSSDRRCLSRSRGRVCLRPCPCLSRPIISHSLSRISPLRRIAAAPVPAARRRRERRLSTALRSRARRPPPAAAVCEYAMPVLRI
jgi:hypothetical protein